MHGFFFADFKSGIGLIRNGRGGVEFAIADAKNIKTKKHEIAMNLTVSCAPVNCKSKVSMASTFGFVICLRGAEIRKIVDFYMKLMFRAHFAI